MNTIASKLLRVCLAGLGLLMLAMPAQALKLDGLDIDQYVQGDEYPAIRLKFNHGTDGWTDVLLQNVEVKIDWKVDVAAAHALAPPSSISISLDTLHAEEELRSTGIEYTERHSGTMTLRGSGGSLDEIRVKALEICATIRGNGGKPNKEHRITRLWKATARVEAYTTAAWFTEEMAKKEKLMRIDVICERDPTWHGPLLPDNQSLAADTGDLRVQKVDLFLTTFKNQVTHPNPATTCPKLKVTVRIETNKAGQIQYILWRQPGDKDIKTVFVDHHAQGAFKGRFVHEYTFWETFDQSTYLQYMVETAGYPVGVSTPWEDIQILCKGTGVGGLAGPAQPGAGNELPKFTVIDSNVVLQRLPGNQCPARVKVIATYRTNMQGSFEHFVGCSNGVNHRGTLSAQDAISDTNFGVRREYIVEMAQGGELICSARAIDFPKELALRKLAVRCDGPAQNTLRAPRANPPPPARTKRD